MVPEWIKKWIQERDEEIDYAPKDQFGQSLESTAWDRMPSNYDPVFDDYNNTVEENQLISPQHPEEYIYGPVPIEENQLMSERILDTSLEELEARWEAVNVSLDRGILYDIGDIR